MRLLFIGDVVGGPGRRGLRETMPSLRERYAPDLIVVNGENSAGGMGITERTANDIFDTGAGVITTGNHVYRHRDAYPFLEREQRVIRPANYPSGNPGRGHTLVEAGGMRVAVINLSGGVGLKVARSPFDAVDAILERDRRRRGDRRLPRRGDQREGGDGLAPRRPRRRRARHPHPRADRRRPRAAEGHRLHLRRRHDRLAAEHPRGADRGRARRAVTQMPTRFETADEDVWVMGAVVDVNQSGLADSIEPVMVPAPAA